MSDEYPICERKIKERVQMTKQEAADLLDNLIGMISDNQNSDYDEALKMGIKALSINVREKHGEWIPFSEEISIFRYEGYHCSKCWRIAKDNKNNFCPNCGADMRGK